MVPVASAPLDPETSQQPGDCSVYYLPPNTYIESTEKLNDGDIKKENVAPMQYIGSGKDDAARSPVRKPHNRNGSLRINGIKKEKVDQSLILEQFRDKDGEHLISVIPEIGYKDSLRHDEKEMPKARNGGGHDLVSGRRAGAGWEQSGYTTLHQQVLRF